MADAVLLVYHPRVLHEAHGQVTQDEVLEVLAIVPIHLRYCPVYGGMMLHLGSNRYAMPISREEWEALTRAFLAWQPDTTLVLPRGLGWLRIDGPVGVRASPVRHVAHDGEALGCRMWLVQAMKLEQMASDGEMLGRRPGIWSSDG